MSCRNLIFAMVLWLGTLAHGGQARYDRIYDRAANEFEAATFFKPAGTNSEDLVFKLAPLVLELGGGTQPTEAGFGALTVSNGVVAVDRSAPAVYFDTGIELLGGRPHLRVVYVWFYQQERGGLLPQGVRMTLDSAGQPAIWEVLRDASGLQPVFAAQSLEQAAAKEHGQPLAGRRYSLEPGIKTAPDIVVARVTEDGPVPMGPMVYVEKQSGDIATVLCRCMPPQFKRLASTRTYKLMPLSLARSALQTLPDTLKGDGRRPQLFDSSGISRSPVQELRSPSNW